MATPSPLAAQQKGRRQGKLRSTWFHSARHGQAELRHTRLSAAVCGAVQFFHAAPTQPITGIRAGPLGRLSFCPARTLHQLKLGGRRSRHGPVKLDDSGSSARLTDGDGHFLLLVKCHVGANSQLLTENVAAGGDKSTRSTPSRLATSALGLSEGDSKHTKRKKRTRGECGARLSISSCWEQTAAEALWAALRTRVPEGLDVEESRGLL